MGVVFRAFWTLDDGTVQGKWRLNEWMDGGDTGPVDRAFMACTARSGGPSVPIAWTTNEADLYRALSKLNYTDWIEDFRIKFIHPLTCSRRDFESTVRPLAEDIKHAEEMAAAAKLNDAARDGRRIQIGRSKGGRKGAESKQAAAASKQNRTLALLGQGLSVSEVAEQVVDDRHHVRARADRLAVEARLTRLHPQPGVRIERLGIQSIL